MKKLFCALLSLYLLLCNMWCFAQKPELLNEKPGMAVGMRSNGKIYVVVAVVVTILAGLFLYLANLDKKISRLEKGQQPGDKL